MTTRLLPTTRLWNASINNPDSFGWALHLGDRIIQAHSMEAEVAIESYEEALKEHPGSPSMYHARYATTARLT